MTEAISPRSSVNEVHGCSLAPTDSQQELTTAIVATGPYSLSRNPIYVSFNLVYVGIAVAVNTVWPIVFLPVGIALLYYGVIAREESYLERVLGEGYRQYKARVRRWV